MHAFVVRVNAHGGPKVVELRGKSVNFRKALQRGADNQGTRDLGFGHVVADGVDVFSQLWKIQVAVGIGKHGSLNKKALYGLEWMV